MATDKSEPRTGVIFKIALFAVVVLVATRGALTSYFDRMASAEGRRKIGENVPASLLDMRADEERRLTGGPLPVDKAMQEIVAHGRMGASPDIAPSASRDLGPLQGWMKMPSEVPAPMMAAPEIPDAGAPAATPVDAGVRADAGTPKKPAKK